MAHKKDVLYIQTLASYLSVKDLSALDVIMGPEELKQVLSVTTEKDFFADRNFINLHTHTTASDGNIKPEDYLDNASRFMQENHCSKLILAVTDHDTIEALPIILKKLVSNPLGYPGLRLVLGCEFSVTYSDETMRRPVDFEILYYGLNPFDSSIKTLLSKIQASRQEALSKMLRFLSNRYPGIRLSQKGLFNGLANSENLRKGLGENLPYQLFNYVRDKLDNPAEEFELQDYFLRLDTPFADDTSIRIWNTFDEVYDVLRQNNFGFISIAHPYKIHLNHRIARSFEEQAWQRGVNPGIDFMRHFLSAMKGKGIEGLEIYYGNFDRTMQRDFNNIMQGRPAGNETQVWLDNIITFAKENKMILTGGSDNHEIFLGTKAKENKKKTLEKVMRIWNASKDTIRQGYKVLGKEVTMILPGPCMPPASEYKDTGIGSPYGDGAKRIAAFFDGVIHKIQLGPGGQTCKETKHSPYVSNLRHNPFFIPLERLEEQGLISKKTLDDIYCIPKKPGRIDFAQVESLYEKALSEAYQNSRSRLSKEDYIESMAVSFLKDAPLPYIMDLQVQIPPEIVQKNKDIVLPDFTLGSPADTFSDKARNWGMKIFHPKFLFEKNGNLGPAGKAWYRVLSTAMRGSAGGLRIDHYIGFVNPYVIYKDDSLPNGRLYSSPDHPILKSFAKTSIEEFSNISEQVILKAAEENGLSREDIYVEDLGSRPEQMDPVMERCGFGRILIAQFVNADDPNHIYQFRNARPIDIAVLDTHDMPSIQMFFGGLDDAGRYRNAKNLADQMRFIYNDNLKSIESLCRMQWGELLKCPARRVQAFFTSFTGQIGRYNQPGNPDKWCLRCIPDFDRLYFENMLRGQAYNPFDAIALAIFARGDVFNDRYSDLVQTLRQTEKQILDLLSQL